VVLWWLARLACAAVTANAARYFFRRPTDHFGEPFPPLLAPMRGGMGAHRLWMIRNFSLTLAAITLGMRLPLLIIVHWPLAWAYVLVSWMCWDLHLVVGPGLVRRPSVAPV